MFTIQQVQNLQWTSGSKDVFTCEVKYAEFDEFLPTGVNATDTAPNIQELWVNGTAGVYGPIADYIPVPQPPSPPPDYSAMRQAAYVAESDPIFFMAQRGEATEQQWLDKVAEIKARWPA